jgi:hypothetical protein
MTEQPDTLPMPNAVKAGPALWRIKRALTPRMTALFLVVLMAVGGWNAYRSWRLAFTDIYQNSAPAVALACTGQLKDFAVQPPPLQDFLALKRTTLDCNELANAGEQPTFVPLSHSPGHQIEGFLASFGLLWKMTGVNWGVVSAMAAVFGAMLPFSLFTLSRTLLGRGESLAVTGLIVVLDLVPKISFTSAFAVYLRDYSKGPFMLLLIALAIIAAEARGRWLLLLAALSGLTTGIGLGFRSDMTLFIAIFPAIFAVRMVLQRERLQFVWAAALFAAALLFVDTFVFNFSAGVGYFFFHWYILGQTGSFLPSLSIVPGSYFLNPVYDDGFVSQFIGLVAQANGRAIPAYNSRPYDNAGLLFFMTQLWNFPADTLLEAYAASVRSLFGLGNWMAASALVHTSCAVILLLFYGPRAYAPIIIIYGLSASTFIQFGMRHYFFYNYIGLFLGCACLFRLAEFLIRMKASRGLVPDAPLFRGAEPGLVPDSREEIVPRIHVRHALVPLLAICFFVGTMALGRTYQAYNLQDVMAGLNAQPGRALPLVKSDPDNGKVLIGIPGEVDERSYVRITIATEYPACATGLSVVLAYRDQFTHQIAAPRGTARIYLPLLQVKSTPPHFLGFQVAADQADCISRIETIDLAALKGRISPLIYLDSLEPKSHHLPYRLALGPYLF